MTFHSADEIDELLKDFEVAQVVEEERDGSSYSGPKHWHVYHVIARNHLLAICEPAMHLMRLDTPDELGSKGV